MKKPASYGSKLCILPTINHLLAAQQEPYSPENQDRGRQGSTNRRVNLEWIAVHPTPHLKKYNYKPILKGQIAR